MSARRLTVRRTYKSFPRNRLLTQSANGNHIPERLEVSVKLILPFRAALLTLFLDATVVGAQTLQVPRIEVGGQVGWVGAIAECFCVLPIVGPRLTVNISQQDALEVSVETLVPSNPATYGCTFFNTSAPRAVPPTGPRFDLSTRPEQGVTTTTAKFASSARRDRMAPW